MTTIAQFEMLLCNLPSEIVGLIHSYAKHPVAEIFKGAKSSGQIRLRHPTIRRFPSAETLLFACRSAFEENDDTLFRQSYEDFQTLYEDHEESIDYVDWVFFKDAFDDLTFMQVEIWTRRGM